jgi:hypothetical protein
MGIDMKTILVAASLLNCLGCSKVKEEEPFHVEISGYKIEEGRIGKHYALFHTWDFPIEKEGK